MLHIAFGKSPFNPLCFCDRDSLEQVQIPIMFPVAIGINSIETAQKHSAMSLIRYHISGTVCALPEFPNGPTTHYYFRCTQVPIRYV